MIAINNFGIREMSVEGEALVKTLKLFAIALAIAMLGVADGALAEQVKKLFFEGDLVRHTLENQKGPFCVLTSQFKRKEAVAWRIRCLSQSGMWPTTKCSRVSSWNWATARSFRHVSVAIHRVGRRRPTTSGLCTGRSRRTTRQGRSVTRSLPR